MKDYIKILIVSMLLLVHGMPTEAQSLRDYIRSRSECSDSLILKAVMPSLSIIRQQYRLERGGEYFGKNNMPYYGECYTLAVKVSGATILQNGVFLPWKGDADYTRVNQTGKYKPVRFLSYQRILNDSIYKPVDWETDSRYTKPIDKDSLLYKNEDPIRNFGLEEDCIGGEKSGYMIWAYSSTNVTDSAMHVTLKSLSFHLNALSDSVDIIMMPDKPEKILGGIFVMPVFKPNGVIHVMLLGVASESNDGKWILHLLTNQSTNVTSIKPKGGNIKISDKKNKEIESPADEPTPVK